MRPVELLDSLAIPLASIHQSWSFVRPFWSSGLTAGVIRGSAKPHPLRPLIGTTTGVVAEFTMMLDAESTKDAFTTQGGLQVATNEEFVR